MNKQTNFSGNKYLRFIKQTSPRAVDVWAERRQGERPNPGEVVVDVYDVLKAFDVKDPGLQQALKKLLCCGIRGKNSFRQDCVEAIEAITRTIEQYDADSPVSVANSDEGRFKGPSVGAAIRMVAEERNAIQR